MSQVSSFGNTALRCIFQFLNNSCESSARYTTYLLFLDLFRGCICLFSHSILLGPHVQRIVYHVPHVTIDKLVRQFFSLHYFICIKQCYSSGLSPLCHGTKVTDFSSKQVFRSSLHPPDYQSRLDIVRANSKSPLQRNSSLKFSSGMVQVR